MTDVSTFGGGLAPQLSAPPAPQGFGSSLQSFLPGPHYTPPDPNATPLDQSANLLSQRVQRASSIATNPMLQLFDPEGVQAARSFIPQATEQLQKIQQQRQQQRDIQSRATNFGVPKGQQNPYMTDDTIDNYLLDRYKNGDFTAANELKARGKNDWVTDFAAQAVDGAGRKLAAARTASDKLTAGAASGQAAYDSALRSLSSEDKQALSDMGLQTIPPKATGWDATVQQHGAVFAQAQQLHAQVVQKFNNMTNFDTSVPKDVGESMAAGVTLGSTSEPAFDGQKAKLRSQDGQIGIVGPNGSVRTDKFGLSPSQGGWSATTPERLEKNDKMFASEDVKGAVNQYNIANKLQHEVNDENMYNSSAGLAFIKDTIGGAARDVAEKSAAAGTVGLSKMWGMQQGGVEGFINKAVNELGALQTYLANGSKGPAPRISDTTKQGLQAIAKANYEFAKTQGAGRLAGAMRYAGQIGRPLEDIPLDAKLKEDVARYHEEGRTDAVNGFNSYPSIVRGNQRVYFQQGANVPGATGPRPAVSPTNPNPPANTNTQPSQTGGNPPVAPDTPTGGGPGPASPSYLANVQRIESGGSKNPWTATTPGSTASGAYQFTNSTWALNKPEGAPARAKDATPEQQTQAMRALTAKNASSLQSAGLPVNDVNLYIAHNLGPGGASSILRAAPNADARTVVGEKNAANNPLFFKGRPTVATVLARYQNEMTKGGQTAGNIEDVARHSANAHLKSNGPTPAEPSFMTRVNRLFSQGIAPGNTFGEQLRAGMPGATNEADLNAARDTAVTDAGNAAVNNAPAIGSTVGAVGGSVLGPAGTIGAGGAGGAAGQVFKDYMQGNPQSPVEIAKQAALGSVLGVAPEGRPLVGAMARVAGVGGVEAGSQAVETGRVTDVAGAAAKGVGYALGGEALGRFVSSAGAQAFKALSRYTTSAQQELSAAAGKLAAARSTLESEPQKVGDAVNPKYEAAKKMAEDAEQAIKDHGQNPDDMVHAYEQAKAGVSSGEAAVMRPAQKEKTEVSQGYNQLRQDVRDTGVGAVKGNPKPTIERSGEPAYGKGTDSMPIRNAEGKKVGDLDFSERKDAIKVTYPHVDPASQGQGLATAAYSKLADYSLARGKPVISDTAVTEQAQRVYNSLERSGYTVERNPNTKDVMGVLHSTDGQPVYRITDTPNVTRGLSDGPVSMLRTADNPTGKVPVEFQPEAEHAEMLIKAPAQNWGQKWQQLQDAGSELIKKRLDFLSNGEGTKATAVDNLFEGVRNQQKAAAEYVFGKEKGAQVISRLENLDTRYAKVMNATAGMKYKKMQSILASGNTPERRELEQNFTAFAKDDPSALRAFNAMKAGARGDWKTEAALMGPVIAGEIAANLHGVPTLGTVSALIGGYRLYTMVRGYMNARLLDKAVTFKDFLAQEVKTGVAQLAQTAAQRTAVQQ